MNKLIKLHLSRAQAGLLPGLCLAPGGQRAVESHHLGSQMRVQRNKEKLVSLFFFFFLPFPTSALYCSENGETSPPPPPRIKIFFFVFLLSYRSILQPVNCLPFWLPFGFVFTWVPVMPALLFAMHLPPSLEYTLLSSALGGEYLITKQTRLA